MKKLNKIYRDIREYLGPDIMFTDDDILYLKKSLEQAYLAGSIDTLKYARGVVKGGDKK